MFPIPKVGLVCVLKKNSFVWCFLIIVTPVSMISMMSPLALCPPCCDVHPHSAPLPLSLPPLLCSLRLHPSRESARQGLFRGVAVRKVVVVFSAAGGALGADGRGERETVLAALVSRKRVGKDKRRAASLGQDGPVLR